MNANLNERMRDAMRLMGTGDLHAATRALQGAGTESDAARAIAAPVRRGPPNPSRDALEGVFRVLHEGRAGAISGDVASEKSREAPVRDRDEQFTAHRYVGGAGTIDYKLFLPKDVAPAGMSLLVMLHGCTQSPDDFARGTKMNALAQGSGQAVLYPAQSQARNPNRCWNWFRGKDQQRGSGEPALLAALTRHVVQTHGLDEHRVYIAGLSAGGAMAAVLGSTYPDLYAAVGVHSGLPAGAASDLPSALAAMKRGGMGAGATSSTAAFVPTIVFHGDRDTTVDPCNGAAVITQSLAGASADAAWTNANAEVEHGVAPGGRRYTRTLHADPNGARLAEEWVVHGAAHAWSGGSSAGSYTDPAGPDASAHMLAFFAQHRRA